MSKLDELMALADACIATYAYHGTSDYMIVDDGNARAALQDALKAVVEDAERYRWLREHTSATGLSRFVRWSNVQFLDEAVDRAMAAVAIDAARKPA